MSVDYYRTNTYDNIVRIFVIRHAQTDCNVTKTLQGHADTLLTEKGLEQADKLGQYLANVGKVKFDKVYSSDLQRCRQTIEKALEYYDPEERPEIEYTEDLRERYMGEVQGMNVEKAESYAHSQGKSSFRDFGESVDDFGARVSKTFSSIVANNLDCHNIAIMTHGGAIRQLINFLPISPVRRLLVFNTSVTVIDYSKHCDRFSVKDFCVTPHLKIPVYPTRYPMIHH